MSARPDDALVEPTASDPIPDLLERTLGMYYLSPSFYVAELCKFVVGTDPWVYAAQHCGGDWESVLRTSDGVNRLATFHRAYATAVDDVHGTVAPWDGSAGGAAGRYLTDLQNALDEQARAVHGISEQLEKIAVSMYELNQAVAEILSVITDAAIRVLIRIAATSIAAATGVGVLGSAAIAASSVVDLVIISDQWRKAIDVHTTVWTSIQGLIGVLTGNLAKIENIEIPGLPRSLGTTVPHRNREDTDESEIVVDVARGDTTLSREIVTSLRSIADATGDPAFAKLVEQVTSGELGVRELAGTEVFSSMLDRLVAPVFESLKETTFEDLVEERPDPQM